jgi:hypothetical protein
MCTVTLIVRRNGYILGMNRDEKRARVLGLPPKLRVVNNRSVLGPSEPGGGTWIAVNDSGITLALINWYSIPARVQTSPISRGEVVNALNTATTPVAAESALKQLPLQRINPFRLIGVFPSSQKIIEWRWNLEQLVRRDCGWSSQQWISSGFDEAIAQRVRGRTFRQKHRQCSVGTLNWLRRLHRSHSPHAGPFSTCMHRVDATTVSYTEIVVSSASATLRHLLGAPCERPACSHHRLKIASR